MKTSSSAPTVVLGATSGFGAALAVELTARGQPVTVVTRSAATLPGGLRTAATVTAVECIDPYSAVALQPIFAGAAEVAFAINVPFPKWEAFIPRAFAATLQAAQACPRPPRVVFPGNVYGLGLEPGRPFVETDPDRPCSRKGRLRARLEAVLREAHAATGLRSLIVRSGDFFGPTVRNGLVDEVFGRLARGRSARIFGRGQAVHTFTYVPELARATADLMAHPGVQPCDVFNAPVVAELPMRALVERAATLAGNAAVQPVALPWPLLGMIGWFSPLVRELTELRYLDENPVRLDTTKFSRLLPHFRRDPLDDAIRITLASYLA